MYDIIGDIHGHADRLEKLLISMGYQNKDSSYKHPQRKALFIGDYIDRGEQNMRVINLVRSMVDDGNAIALMGNHEYNALCFHEIDPDGGYLREHTPDNIKQHYKTIEEYTGPNKGELEKALHWMMNLHLFYEDDHIRAVHACWDSEYIDYLKDRLINGKLTNELLHESADDSNHLHHVIDETLKGKEAKLPNDHKFQDKDGKVRSKIRVRWWENNKKRNYKEMLVTPISEDNGARNLENLYKQLELTPFDKDLSSSMVSPNDKPVFFGHYWLKGEPKPIKKNVCCVDYSVAEGGKLVAYRYEIEDTLDQRNFIAI